MADRYSSRTLREIVRVIASRFVTMVIIFVMVVAAVCVATYFAPRIYRSEAELRARPSGLTSPVETRVTSMRDEVSLFVRTQRQIIKSDYVLATALMLLEGREPAWDQTDIRKSSISKQIRRRISTIPLFSDEQVNDYLTENARYMSKARRRVSVVTPGGPDATFTQTWTIKIDWPQERAKAGSKGMKSREIAAKRAYQLASHLTDAYLARSTFLESRTTLQAKQLLVDEALAQASFARNLASSNLEKFIKNELQGDLLHVINMIGKGGGGIETGVASLTREFKGQLMTIAEKLASAGAMQAAIDIELAKVNPADLVVPDSILKANPPIMKINEKVVTLKLHLNSLLPKYTEQYQEIQHVRSELGEAQLDLKNELAKQRARIGQEASVLTARQAILARRVDQDKQLLDDLALKAVEYQRLQDDVATAQSIYEEETKRVVSATTASQLAEQPILVSLIDGPSRPSAVDPVGPNVLLSVVVSAVGGLILAITLAFMGDYFDHSIKSTDDAERYLGVPVLASVPKLGRKAIKFFEVCR